MIPQFFAVVDFVAATPPQPLADDEIHLWFFPQRENVPAAAGSAPVRELLAAYLNCAAASVRIERSAKGKPRLIGAPALEFNLSHAGPALLLGVSRNSVLGVDLEIAQRRLRPVLELARRFFAPEEAAALEAMPEGSRQSAFLRLWCAKEAVLKAMGEGIAFGLDRIAFVLDEAGNAAPAVGSGWRLRALAPAPGYVGALAHREPVGPVRAFVAST